MIFPESVRYGEGELHYLPTILNRLELNRILCVVDSTAYEHCGAKPVMEMALANRQSAWFTKFDSNPKLEDVEIGVRLFRQFLPDGIVALGGGSALDMAKLVGLCGSQSSTPRQLVVNPQRLTSNSVPLIAIPTTAGTGSEATRFAVVYVDRRKHSIAHPSMLPVMAIIDPNLTANLPPPISATSGLDALCQAIESLWAIDASDESIPSASHAIELAHAHLVAAVNDPSPVARRAMAKAAYLSGKAINITKTTAPHALSYALTTHYHVPHGAAVALWISEFLRYNGQVDERNCCDSRGPEAVRGRIALIVSLLGACDVEHACQRLNSLIENVGCPTRLGQVGVTRTDVPRLASGVNHERLGNNPRRVDAFAIERLMSSLI